MVCWGHSAATALYIAPVGVAVVYPQPTIIATPNQWHNRREAVGRVPLQDFWLGNFCWRIGKKEARKKGERGKNWEERRKIVKGRWKIGMEMEVGKVLKRVGDRIKRSEDLFFFFFFFFWLFTFQNDGNLSWVYWEKAFHTRKKSGKMTLPPQKNMPVTPLLPTLL